MRGSGADCFVAAIINDAKTLTACKKIYKSPLDRRLTQVAKAPKFSLTGTTCCVGVRATIAVSGGGSLGPGDAH
jgi:hypothetical protein